ncbi:unnamed protein product [Symbiodinium microadriaticum]|nr:unnamed protein product [Symbiodinium microadriaticum]
MQERFRIGKQALLEPELVGKEERDLKTEPAAWAAADAPASSATEGQIAYFSTSRELRAGSEQQAGKCLGWGAIERVDCDHSYCYNGKVKQVSERAAAQSTNTVYEEEAPEEAENEVREWLRGLDSGRGALVIYTKAITEEFGGVPALSACILPEHPKGSVIGRIEQSLWEALDVKSLGHRLLLAKGILKLE